MIVRSDYEQQKILSELMESEKQRYKFVKNKALIPPMLLSSRDRFVHQRVGFQISSTSTHFPIMNARHYRSFELQNNNLDTTPFVVQEQAKKLRPWTDVEKCIFVDKFLQVFIRATLIAPSVMSTLYWCVLMQFPKDFSKIAKALVNRSTKDAVEFYYNTK